MSRGHHLQSMIFLDHMSRAIRVGYAEGVELLLQYEETRLSPAVLSPFVSMAFNAQPFAQITDFRTHGQRPDTELLPKDEQTYEGNLRWIIAALYAHGASVPQTDSALAQRAFSDMSPHLLRRHPARFEVVAQTLQRDPNWLPDLVSPFKQLDCLPTDGDAAQKRQKLADHMGELGCEIGQWLKHWCPTGHLRDTTKTTYAPFMNQMTPNSQAFWLRQNWNLTPVAMPWGNADKIRQEREASQLSLNIATAAIQRARQHTPKNN